MRSALRGLLESVYRREPEGTPTPALLRGRWAIFLALSFLLLGPLFTALYRHLTEWTEFAADLPLPKSQWRALYETSPEPCGLAPSASAPRCLADPANPALWESPATREDQQLHKRRVFERRGQEYWIGTTVSPAQLRVALSREANFLVLGQLRGSSTIWVDGRQMMSGRWLDNEPVVVQLPLEWLASPRPLKIAVRLVRNVDINDSADALEEFPRLGLAAKAGAASWKRYQYFWGTSRPLVFLALNFLLAWIFFAVWLVDPGKTEYFYIAFLAMAFALFQLRYVELFYVAENRRLVNAVGLITAIVYAFAGMLAGFSFARVRSALMTASLWACFGACVVCPLLVTDTIRQQIQSGLWMGSIADLGTVLGAAACYLQAYRLYANTDERAALRQRIGRLVLFGTSLLFLTLLNQINYTAIATSYVKILFGKSGPFFMLLSLGLVALSEYRTQHALAQAMPISRFHRLHPLPESVKGVLFNVDLKDSEQLARLSARLGRAGDLVETCLSHMWAAVSQNGGLVLQTEGDALRALFPADELPDPARAAFLAADAMRRNLAELEGRFISQGVPSKVLAGGLHFRGAVVEGEIRPIWQAYGGSRLAGWVETGHVNVFIEAARLLELERQVAKDEPAPGSVVIALPELKSRLASAGLTGRWLFERRAFEGKHAQSYDVAAYRT